MCCSPPCKHSLPAGIWATVRWLADIHSLEGFLGSVEPDQLHCFIYLPKCKGLNLCKMRAYCEVTGTYPSNYLLKLELPHQKELLFVTASLADDRKSWPISIFTAVLSALCCRVLLNCLIKNKEIMRHGVLSTLQMSFEIIFLFNRWTDWKVSSLLWRKPVKAKVKEPETSTTNWNR